MKFVIEANTEGFPPQAQVIDVPTEGDAIQFAARMAAPCWHIDPMQSQVTGQ